MKFMVFTSVHNKAFVFLLAMSLSDPTWQTGILEKFAQPRSNLQQHLPFLPLFSDLSNQAVLRNDLRSRVTLSVGAEKLAQKLEPGVKTGSGIPVRVASSTKLGTLPQRDVKPSVFSPQIDVTDTVSSVHFPNQYRGKSTTVIVRHLKVTLVVGLFIS